MSAERKPWDRVKDIQLWVAPWICGLSAANSLHTQCWTWKDSFPTFSVSTWNLLIPFQSEHLHFILASKCAHEPLSLIAHISWCWIMIRILNPGRASYICSWGRLEIKELIESLVPWHYTVVKDSSILVSIWNWVEFQHSYLQHQWGFLTSGLCSPQGQPKYFFIPTSQKSWRKRTEAGSLEYGLLDGISGLNETFYVRNWKELF